MQLTVMSPCRGSVRSLCAEQEARETPGVKMEDGKPMLEILKGISGAFRPGILTSLMGVSGEHLISAGTLVAGPFCVGRERQSKLIAE